MVTALVSFIIVVGIMVVVHEFGHFAVAKFFGVRVEVFSIGMGKRLFGFRRGDTDYRISLLPLGGYVKMSGENPGEEATGDPGEFTAHPRWQRVLIGLAGPMANFVLAFVLMGGYFMMHNEIPDYVSQPAQLDNFVPTHSPAGEAGIKGGDRIVRFDGVENPNWEQVSLRMAVNAGQTVNLVVLRNGQRIPLSLYLEDKKGHGDFKEEMSGLLPQMQPSPITVESSPAALETNMPAYQAGLRPGDVLASVDGIQFHGIPALLLYLQEQAGKPAHIEVLRGSQKLQLVVTPRKVDDQYRLGFRPSEVPFHVEQMSLPAALVESASFNYKNAGLIMDVLHRMVTRRIAMQQLSGPVGIARQTGMAASMHGWQPMIMLMTVISLNLGIFNLLPIPILDGGMILLLIIEGTLRRDLNQEFKERIYQAAFVMLILFAVFVTFNDVSKLPLPHFRP